MELNEIVQSERNRTEANLHDLNFVHMLLAFDVRL